MYKVLIVDDEPFIREGIAQLPWNMLNIKVTATAANGMEAYEYLKNNEIDLLLTDVKMPFMDGVELIRRIKNENKDIVCIVLSGYDDFEYVRPCLQNNVFDYLLKPLDIDDWSSTFKRAISLFKEKETNSNIDIGEHSKKHIVDPALLYMQQHFCEQITLADVAKHIYTNPTYLSRIIKQETGTGFTELLTKMRVEAAKKMLRDPTYKINEIAKKVGYVNPRSFTSIFKKYTGYTPYIFRSEQK